MRVLILHNAYQQYGGEDTVVRMESELLSAHGNLAGLHIFSNERIHGFWSKISAAVGVVFSLSSYRAVRRLIQESKPDVVHVHNFFPLLSPSAFYACRAENVPVVLTLHNFRILCPTALLLHDNKVTERSIHDGPWWALRHRVYRGSWVGTFFLCLMIWFHRKAGTWDRKVNRFIALSQFGREKFSSGGIPESLIDVKPNFIDAAAPSSAARTGLLYVGRLSPEKGIDLLLTAIQKLNAAGKLHGDDISILGSGPLSEAVCKSHVDAPGSLSNTDVRMRMGSACALLVPSICYEGFPLVLVEAYAFGLPVIASRIGVLAELVEDGVTGLHFEPGNANELAEKMAWALQNPEKMRCMGLAARERYEALYTPERNYERLISIYESVITDQGRCSKPG